MLWAEQKAGLWPLVGVVVAMLLLLMTFWRMSRRATGQKEVLWPTREQGDSLSSGGERAAGGGGATARLPMAGVPESLTAWEVQMHETAREISALVDTKLRLLQHLVAEADRAATRLERALDAAQTCLSQPTPSSQTRLDDQSGLGANPACEAIAQPESPSSGQPDGTVPLEVPDSQAEAFGAPSEGSGALAPGVPWPANRVRPEALALEVGLLADYGFPAQEIASRCGISVSEVEMLLRERNAQDHKRSSSNK